jgi:hypothetical protein
MWHLFSRWVEHIKFPHFIKKFIRVKSPIIAICLLPIPRPIPYCHTFFDPWVVNFHYPTTKKERKSLYIFCISKLITQVEIQYSSSCKPCILPPFQNHCFFGFQPFSMHCVITCICIILSYSFWNRHCDLCQFQFVPWWPMLSQCCTSS